MNLIVHQMMQFQVMHVSDRNRAVEKLSRPSVTEPYLPVTGQRNPFPELPVLSVVR